MMQTVIRKILIGIAAVFVFFAFGDTEVSAATLNKNTVVYITSSGNTYHVKSNCSGADSKRTYAKTLYDVLRSGKYKMCKTCAKEIGMNINDSQNLTLEMLPYNTDEHSGSDSGWEEASDDSGSASSDDGTSETSSGNGSGSSGESGSKSGSSNGSDSGSGSGNQDNGGAASSGNGQSSSGSGSQKTTNSKKTTAKSSGSSNSSNNSSGVQELMTQKERRNKFLSKSNPKRGKKPKVVARPASDGFEYADFAKFNSYNSDNGLGGTPIYLVGTIKDIQPVKQLGSLYGLAVMVDDYDGYQWYMRCQCDRSNYDRLKADLMGKLARIYGTYAGYSGVTNRPMMDISRVVDDQGNDYDMASY